MSIGYSALLAAATAARIDNQSVLLCRFKRYVVTWSMINLLKGHRCALRDRVSNECRQFTVTVESD